MLYQYVGCTGVMVQFSVFLGTLCEAACGCELIYSFRLFLRATCMHAFEIEVLFDFAWVPHAS